MSRFPDTADTPDMPRDLAQQPGGVWVAYWQLIRPRILAMVLAAMFVACVVAAAGHVPWVRLAHGLAGSALVIMGAVALNQRLEWLRDARMRRTASRPLPQGRLQPALVSRLAAGVTVLGLAYLVLATNTATVLLAAASWLLYVWVYTPLKPRSAWQTPIGAAAGAMPTLLGAAVVNGLHEPMAWALFGVLYFWQIPHSMAIAWLYRGDFAAAQVRLATVVEPSGRAAGIAALVSAVAMIPASLVPVFAARAGLAYGLGATLLGTLYALSAAAFLAHRDERRARLLLRASLVYLPLLLAALLAASAG